MRGSSASRAGARHAARLEAPAEARANDNLDDRGGTTPLALAKARGQRERVALPERPGSKEPATPACSPARSRK